MNLTGGGRDLGCMDQVGGFVEADVVQWGYEEAVDQAPCEDVRSHGLHNVHELLVGDILVVGDRDRLLSEDSAVVERLLVHGLERDARDLITLHNCMFKGGGPAIPARRR